MNKIIMSEINDWITKAGKILTKDEIVLFFVSYTVLNYIKDKRD